MRYIDHPEHARTKGHYYRGQYRALHLAMAKDWWEAEMPKGVRGIPATPEEKAAANPLRVVYLDRTDGKTYETWMYPAWDRNMRVVDLSTFDGDWNLEEMAEAVILQEYFYGRHNCPCHRKQDAASCGAVTDDECEGDRFPVLKIYSPTHPDLVLYSETMSEEELNDLVEMGRGRPEGFVADDAVPGGPPLVAT